MAVRAAARVGIGLFARSVFECGEEALLHGVVIAVAGATHTGLDVVGGQQRMIVVAGTLPTPVGMVQQPFGRLASGQRHAQGTRYQSRCHVVIHRPAGGDIGRREGIEIFAGHTLSAVGDQVYLDKAGFDSIPFGECPDGNGMLEQHPRLGGACASSFLPAIGSQLAVNRGRTHVRQQCSGLAIQAQFAMLLRNGHHLREKRRQALAADTATYPPHRDQTGHSCTGVDARATAWFWPTLLPLAQRPYGCFVVQTGGSHKFIQDLRLLCTAPLKVAVPYVFDHFSLALLTHFLSLHHGDESNTSYEATTLPSVTLFLRQCDPLLLAASLLY